ncbi:unnamed protein product [Callosobruchus maculatus]|uniref:Uncharacterized protein n=1 Tax=Callosobruchus maculatus TaxID=64391 RepID=A0A653DWS1_CALMS|nr:unnamed protein product [Callosobruchus maculatus]
MVMGQFVTTYRKDYLWPYVKTLGMRPEPERLYERQLRDGQQICPCHCLPPPSGNDRVLLGSDVYEKEQWSRMGPMGPLLDPKTFPAKVGSAPESEVGRYNQPNVFLKKLQEKYPFIYECLRTAPPDDMISRINRDRLSTTYEVDYCKKNEYPSAPYEELLRAAGVEGLAPCSEPVRLPGDPCRPLKKVSISNRIGGGKACGGLPKSEDPKRNEQNIGSCKAGFFALTYGVSEYQDTYSRLGHLIVRDGLHNPSRKRR